MKAEVQAGEMEAIAIIGIKMEEVLLQLWRDI